MIFHEKVVVIEIEAIFTFRENIAIVVEIRMQYTT
jgi:hypothetical protein